MQRNDLLAFVVALLITGGLAWLLIYFWNELWPILPGWLAMIVFIFVASAVIGYPIYALAKWSDRYLARTKERQGKAALRPCEQDREGR